MTDLERATSLVRKHRDPAMTAIAVANALAEARRAALEEAALTVERCCDSPVVVEVAGRAAAKAIRGLKEKH